MLQYTNTVKQLYCIATAPKWMPPADNGNTNCHYASKHTLVLCRQHLSSIHLPETHRLNHTRSQTLGNRISPVLYVCLRVLIATVVGIYAQPAMLYHRLGETKNSRLMIGRSIGQSAKQLQNNQRLYSSSNGMRESRLRWNFTPNTAIVVPVKNT